MTASKKKSEDMKDATQGIHTDVRDASNAAYERVKEAIPSLEGLGEQAGDDLRSIADDATSFVRRNPAVSIAAAAGIGVLIGVLATRRS